LGFTGHHERRKLLPVLFRETFPLISEDFSFKGPEESLGSNYITNGTMENSVREGV
jgi:hypothetical protein